MSTTNPMPDVLPPIPCGLGLPVVQQVPGRARAWEASAGPREVERVAVTADRLGFAHLACSDHVIVPSSRIGAMGATWYDPIATLAHLGGCTRRIELLTHVLVLPVRHPMVLAKSLATLDRMSGGRLVVGIGAGHLKPEFRALGVEFEDRGAATDEAIEVLDALWTQTPAAHLGVRHRFADVVLEPKPVRSPRPPIWVGGNSRRSVRRSVELGDGWVPWNLATQELRDLIAHGRDLRARQARPRPWQVVAPLPTIDLVGAGGEHPGEPVLRGSADEIAAVAHGLRAAGVSRFVVAFLHRGCEELLDQLEAFATRVGPLL